MRPSITAHIPQLCHESWAAMTPAAAGRYCAACQKTVVDFTLQSDADIVAHLARATGGRTCGRFAAGQLGRPLQGARPAAPTRWRAWLAAAVAVWGLRETGGLPTQAQAVVQVPPQYRGGPVPTAPLAAPAPAIPVIAAKPTPPNEMLHLEADSSVVVRGVITDVGSGEQLPGATVLLQGTTVGISTNQHGAYELVVPRELVTAASMQLQVSFLGYVTQQRSLTVDKSAALQSFCLQPDVKGMWLGEVVVVESSKLPPAPWHPRVFYHWGKYWLTRPFRSY